MEQEILFFSRFPYQIKLKILKELMRQSFKHYCFLPLRSQIALKISRRISMIDQFIRRETNSDGSFHGIYEIILYDIILSGDQYGVGIYNRGNQKSRIYLVYFHNQLINQSELQPHLQNVNYVCPTREFDDCQTMKSVASNYLNGWLISSSRHCAWNYLNGVKNGFSIYLESGPGFTIKNYAHGQGQGLSVRYYLGEYYNTLYLNNWSIRDELGCKFNFRWNQATDYVESLRQKLDLLHE